ncbi:MAG: hypothetical protein ACK4NA_00685 [Alphaproteobacteria bacterium]
MLAFRHRLGFGNLSRALIVAFGLGFALGAPIDSAQPAHCTLVHDCAVVPAEEPRERASLSLGLAGTAFEKQQRAVPAILPAASVAAPLPSIPESAAFGERRELRHARGRENLPDKTGPPAA